MKGYIPDIKVEEIKNRTDIVDLISEHVSLRKTGRNFIGLCPFHKEKTPSFTVTPDRQMFYCFGCGEGGGVFTFLMKISQMTYPEAVRHLARKAGVIIPERITQLQRQQDSLRERIVRINETAAGYFEANLFSPAGKEALIYLSRRGIKEEVVRSFRLGLSLGGWRHLRDFLEKEKASLDDAQQAGLVIQGKDAAIYDRFRARLMFPLEDVNGRVIAFGGRIIGEGEPKYLNSPESDVYVKGRNLYGLSRAKNYVRSQGYAIVVEGYFDLISLWNAGITNVVATMGTALTKEQIELIGRYAKQVVVLFDPDEAGQKAATKSMELFLTSNLSGKILVLPGGHDPDDYTRLYGGESLMDLINRAPSFSDYYIDHVLADKGGYENHRDSMHRAVAFIRRIEDVIERNLFIKRVSEKLGIDQEILKKEISQGLSTVASTAAGRADNKVESEKLELSLICLLLTNPEKIVSVLRTKCLDHFQNKQLKQFGEILLQAAEDAQGPDFVDMISLLPGGALRDGLMKMFMEENFSAQGSMADRLISDTIRQIKRRWYKQQRKMLMLSIKKAQDAGDMDLCNSLLMEQDRLAKEERGL